MVREQRPAPVNTRSGVDANKRRAAIERENAQADLRFITMDPRGRRWLWKLLVSCNIYASCFDTNGSIMSKNEGRRDVGLGLVLELSQLDPALIYQMAQENAKTEEEREDANA